MVALPATFTDWFAARGWSIHPHQRAMLDRADAPALLLVAPTGGGKTLAGFLPTLAELADGEHKGLHTLYISPLKALAADIITPAYLDGCYSLGRIYPDLCASIYFVCERHSAAQ